MGTTAEKLKYLNETKAEIKNALETPYNVMRDYPELIKKYIDNQPTKVVTDGICGNAVDVPVKTIETNGNIRQETTEGYNLLNIESKFKVTGSERIPISLPAGEYTIKADNIVTDSSSQTSFVTSFRTSSEAIADVRLTLSNHKLKFTLLKPATFAVIYSGNSFNESQGVTTTYTNLMIYEGTSDKPYEPYTGGISSPNPDYTQKITSVGGYDNIFDKNNIISGSYVSDSNGAFTANSTSKRTDYLEIQANSYYYIYSDKTSGNWGAWYDKDKKFISGIALGGQKEGTVNSPANAKYMAFTVSYQGNLTDYSKIKINETAIKIKQSGKNLFDNTLKGYGHYGTTAKTIPTGVRLSVDTDVTASDYIFGCYAIINLLNFVGKTVRMKAMFKSNSNLKGSYTIGLCNSNGANRAPKGSTGVSEKEISFVIPSLKTGQEYLGVWFYANSEGTGVAGDYVDYTNVIITIDNEDITYEPYHEPKVITINLQGNILSKGRNVKDISKVNRNGEVEIKKNIRKVILDGSEDENWKVSGKTFYTDSINDYSAETFVPMSDYFTGVSSKGQATSMTVDNTIAFANFRSPSRLYIKYDKMETIDAFKTWLSQHPTEVYYELATPQIITLPSISPIELWQGTNIFKLITNLDTDFEVEYVVDKDSVTKEGE